MLSSFTDTLALKISIKLHSKVTGMKRNADVMAEAILMLAKVTFAKKGQHIAYQLNCKKLHTNGSRFKTPGNACLGIVTISQVIRRKNMCNSYRHCGQQKNQ